MPTSVPTMNPILVFQRLYTPRNASDPHMALRSLETLEKDIGSTQHYKSSRPTGAEQAPVLSGSQPDGQLWVKSCVHDPQRQRRDAFHANNEERNKKTRMNRPVHWNALPHLQTTRRDQVQHQLKNDRTQAEDNNEDADAHAVAC